MMDAYEKRGAGSLRLHVIGGLIYTCMVTAALGAASWGLLSLMSPLAP